jgi:hypothetical protein
MNSVKPMRKHCVICKSNNVQVYRHGADFCARCAEGYDAMEDKIAAYRAASVSDESKVKE